MSPMTNDLSLRVRTEAYQTAAEPNMLNYYSPKYFYSPSPRDAIGADGLLLEGPVRRLVAPREAAVVVPHPVAVLHADPVPRPQLLLRNRDLELVRDVKHVRSRHRPVPHGVRRLVGRKRVNG